MSEAPTDEALAIIARRIAPGAVLARTWSLRGGISARMTALELTLPNGGTCRAVLRQPGEWAIRENRQAAEHEYRVLQIVRALGVGAPAALLYDNSGTILPTPYLVLEFIEGEPEHSPADVAAYAAQMAAELARIHRVDPALPGLAFLRRGDGWLTDAIRERAGEVDDALRARDIRAALRASRPLPHPNPPVLLHGDPWPGNIVWRDGRLVAMIDWEEAHIGDPLEDLAVARFDMLCMLGRQGMEQYTRAYALAQPQVDLTDLPYWDLYAALRPVNNIADWAGGWQDLGRPDITEGVLRAAHREFVAQAFDR